MSNISLFQSYENEFLEISQNLISKIETSIPVMGLDQRRFATKLAQKDVEEAEELIGQMELEILNLKGSEKIQATPRVKRYKTQIASLKKDLRNLVSESGGSNRERMELLGGHSNYYTDASDFDQRAGLLQGTNILEQSSRRLQDSHRVAIETEAVGASILNDLRLQREQIVHTRDSLMQADAHIDTSQRTLKAMARRLGG
ncbi:hypothetical protein BB559_002979 [Furculomyces boomerangus]|uniref:t-SNARE coiled-coil homology domain-containing protein n=2 Tax=Harpellales TaxID=61421 RepID=A0A2T9YQ61_9FUNG|nr:hypothetical protein BB559_002979 [Furculomyces boomerangus]PVZ97885.1 hypothetical protein BB558_006142 [Smittium angustum]